MIQTAARPARDGDAKALTARIARACRPNNRHLHIVEGAPSHQVLVVNGSRLYTMPPETAAGARELIATGDDGEVERWLQDAGLALAPAIVDQPPAPGRVHALSLAVAQKCNLGCSYCYAQQGSFGGAAKNMSFDTARAAVDLLMRQAGSGDKVSLTFLGGEPLQNRSVIRATTEYATRQASDRGVRLSLSLTTNGTLVTPDDAEFLETHGFAVTVSIDGPAEVHDRLRPFKSGRGSFEHTVKRILPLLERQRAMQVSARVTVTPLNLDLLTTLDMLIGMGFHSVGFSPLLHAPSGAGAMDAAGLARMLEAMIRCGLSFEEHVIRGVRYPFLNMTNALRELHRGTHRPYPCGAGAGYFGVSADGDLSACHRFVGDRQGQFGNIASGVDTARQVLWLSERHVHRQTPCSDCWARYLCGGGCHHEVLAGGRPACDFIRGWLHYTIQAHGRLSSLLPTWFDDNASPHRK
jgi:uncharacterized protein